MRGSKRSAGAASPRSSATIAVIAAMIRSVAAATTALVCSWAARSLRSTGSPTFMVTVLRGNRSGFFAYGASTSCAPHCPIGMTGQPVSSAIRAAPDLPVIGHVAGSRVIVPSG